ncbi:hypothetical protein F4819DRAFT_456116 [Hypoxylon fuscum]|nr:hypothetical protein F4819DRAFT_456116 [Hypoxylon fuscum]
MRIVYWWGLTLSTTMGEHNVYVTWGRREYRVEASHMRIILASASCLASMPAGAAAAAETDAPHACPLACLPLVACYVGWLDVVTCTGGALCSWLI